MCTDTSSDQPPPSAASSAGAEERSFGLRIAADGTWYHDGAPIRRIELVRLFASVLRRADDGSFWLVTPVERGRIEVEDAPFVAVELAAEGSAADQTVRLRTNLDEWITLGPAHPLRLRRMPQQTDAAGPVPYVEVRAGLEARLARPVYYELVALGAPEEPNGGGRFGVWSAGRFFALDLQ